MALTNQQVQAAYLAITGRPAEGSAVTWASASFTDVASLVSSIIDIRKGGDFSNNKETFVENLYQNLLGRASDAEGKEFWLKALNDGASYAQVAQNFINVVLGQSQTEDLYTLQNKLGIAEQISAQINTFQGGAAAEATLKALMKDVNANTTIDSIQDSVDNFVGNSVNIKTVTINPADTEPTEIKGSAENATVFNLSLDVASDNPSMSQTLTGSTKFADTLNVKVTSSDKDTVKSLNDIGSVSGIKTLNITTDATIETTNLTIPTGVQNLSFTGKSEDTVNVNADMTSLNTGGGVDNITLNAKVNSVNAGAGNDDIKIAVASKTIKIDGGEGRDTVTLSGDNTKVSLTNVEVLKTSAAAEVSKALLDGKSYELNTTHVITVSAKNGIDLSKIKVVTDEASSGFAITDVTSGKVALSAADQTITETITLGANANKVTITNIDATDNIVFSKIANFSGSSSGTLGNSVSGAMVNKTAYLFNMDTGSITSEDAVAKALAAAGAKGTVTASDKFAIFVTNGTDKTAIYYVDQNDNQSAITKGELKLLATFDEVASGANKLTSDGLFATFTFA